MITIFSTGKASHRKINNVTDTKIKDFDQSLNNVLLNLAKRVVSDGEGASKFITVKVKNCKTEEDAKKIAFSIANSPLVKTAIAGEDPNWGRIIMAIGKSDAIINLDRLSIKFGDLNIVYKGKINSNYNEKDAADYMKNSNIEITVDASSGKKFFTVYNEKFLQFFLKLFLLLYIDKLIVIILHPHFSANIKS